MRISARVFVTAAATLAFGLAVSSAQAAGDAKKGANVFKRCAICHSAAKGAPNKIGPNLWGIVGSKAADVPGFNFSPAMKKSNITWTPEKLDAYITHPAQVVPGNKMAFAGVSNKKQREDLIAFLETLK